MLAHLPLIAFITLFAITLMIGAGYAVVHHLYFSGRTHRRMPSWLIVLVIMSFLVLPRLDTVYLSTRTAERQAIHE